MRAWRTRSILGLVAASMGVLAAHAAHAADRDALREIVQAQCVPHWLAAHAAEPCASVELPQGAQELGYALLPDRNIECVQSDVHAALAAAVPRLGGDWQPVAVPGWRLVGLRVLGERLDASPFRLLAERLPQAQGAIGDYSLFVTGAQFAEGPGFVVLAGTGPGTERLLDSTCELAGGGVASGATAR